MFLRLPAPRSENGAATPPVRVCLETRFYFKSSASNLTGPINPDGRSGVAGPNLWMFVSVKRDSFGRDSSPCKRFGQRLTTVIAKSF